MLRVVLGACTSVGLATPPVARGQRIPGKLALLALRGRHARAGNLPLFMDVTGGRATTNSVGFAEKEQRLRQSGDLPRPPRLVRKGPRRKLWLCGDGHGERGPRSNKT